MEINYKNLDGWSIPREVFEWIINNIPQNSSILELGSGNGTKELVKLYNVYSIEENIKWVNVVEGTTYIYAPIKPTTYMEPHTSGWYDLSCFEKIPNNYNAVIIDGPVGNNRINFIHFCDFFKPDVPYIIDDTQRSGDKIMALSLAKKMKKEIIEINGWQKKAIILI
jgi:hypothetical protein